MQTSIAALGLTRLIHSKRETSEFTLFPTAKTQSHLLPKRYQFNVDKTVQLMKFVGSSGKPLGAITWFPVHCTSMNNTNKLISGDNKGFASMLLERDMNPGYLPGKGPFVAAFPNPNQGDVSPNTRGSSLLVHRISL